jgi:hypothetical protein
MSEGSLNWKKGCGIGCAVILGIGILAFAIGGMVITRPFRSAVAIRETLDREYGSQETFTPEADGSVPAERIEAFLRVRGRLMTNCGHYDLAMQGIKGLERLDGIEDPPKGEVMKGAWQATRAVFGMGPMMGRFFKLRNSALLAAEMGLGEYTYIYAVAYRDSLMAVGIDADGSRTAVHVGRRIHEALTGMLRRQLEASPADSVMLRQEIQLLEAGEHRLPWQAGLPPRIEASLAPYRAHLDSLYCPHTTHLELMRNKIFAGIGIQGD